MQNYSEEFKTKMVQKLLGPSKTSALRLSRECGVGQPTLSRWLREAKVGSVKETPKVKARKRWSPEEKMRVVLAATAAGDAGSGEVLRREGLHDEDLERFKTELIAGPSAKVPKRDPADRKQIKILERELRRKEKALAEAAALVVLSKKLNAYFDPDGVGESYDENEK